MRENSYDEPIPEVEITGNNYEVGGIKYFISQIIGYLRIFCFALIFAGESVFTLFGGLRSMP